MGNRAVIITESADMGLYLHWDGSPDQVQVFLSFCHMMEYRTPEQDEYGWAQLTKVIGNYIDENQRSHGLSIGVFPIRSPQNSPTNPSETPSENAVETAETPHSRLSPELLASLSPGDNGVYVIRDWQVIRHVGGYQSDEPLSPGALLAWLEAINDCQPYHLPEEELKEYVYKNAGLHETSAQGA